MSVAVLASGSGTILSALLDARMPVCAVLADRPCRALEVARDAGIAAELLDRSRWGGYGPGFDRVRYTEAVTGALERYDPAVVAMAGFGTVLAEPVHSAYPGRILNTHPTLLPAFPGWHAVADALDAGVKVTGCTVHLATLEMDGGPILAQEAVAVHPDDTVDSLHERIKTVERRLYPATIRQFLGDLGDPVSHDRRTEEVQA